jgi:uncharacterized protein (TIGR02001 family)
MLSATRADAQDGQLGARAAIDSDLRWHGYTFSAGQPVASVDVTYDALSGFYLNGSVVVQLRHADPRYLGYAVGGGYAARINDRWSIDTGVEHAAYRAAYQYGPEYRYTQVYVGVTHGLVLARASYSPDYFGHHVQALYFEVESAVALARSLRLSGHAGFLGIVDRPTDVNRFSNTRYDWRIGLTRSLGPAEFHVNLSGAGPSRQFYDGASHNGTALTAGASLSF